MVYTLTLNPSIDYSISIKDIDKGQLNKADEVFISAGGKGINVSRMLHNLNIDSIAMGFVGGFTGDYIINSLNEEGILTDFIPVDGITRINLKIKENVAETEIAGVSPLVEMHLMSDLIKKIGKIKKGNILVMAGSVPSGISSNIYKYISEANPEILTVLDTRGNLLQQNMSSNFLIKPNINELQEMAGIKFTSIKEIINYCSYFLNNGIINIIVSMGSEGAIIVNSKENYYASAPRGKVANTVGAGDSMVAGFLAGIKSGMSLRESFCLAAAAGSATAFSDGIADKVSVEKLYPQIKAIKI